MPVGVIYTLRMNPLDEVCFSGARITEDGDEEIAVRSRFLSQCFNHVRFDRPLKPPASALFQEFLPLGSERMVDGVEQPVGESMDVNGVDTGYRGLVPADIVLDRFSHFFYFFYSG